LSHAGKGPCQAVTRKGLYNQAKRLNIKGRPRMNKRQLLAAVNRKS